MALVASTREILNENSRNGKKSRSTFHLIKNGNKKEKKKQKHHKQNQIERERDKRDACNLVQQSYTRLVKGKKRSCESL